MNRNESKYFNTAVLMDKALIMLLEKKDFQFITVKEICRKAGVNRSTFYLHYENISDLLEETNEYIKREFLASFEASPESFLKRIGNEPLDRLIVINDEFLRPYLIFVSENKCIFKATLNNPSCLNAAMRMSMIKKHVLLPILSRFNIPEAMQKYWIAYYLSGVTAVIKEWIEGGCSESVDFIERVIIECVLPSDKTYVEKYGERDS